MKPLKGIRVIDLTHMLAGPYAGMVLADLGAETIKVEPVGTGEMTRTLLVDNPKYSLKDLGAYFLTLNRNKKSISLDIRTDEGKKIVSQLCETADVFILNMRPGTEKQFELDFESLFKSNPKLIYVSISGFGSEGPDASLPGYDIVLQAKSGVLSLRGVVTPQ